MIRYILLLFIVKLKSKKKKKYLRINMIIFSFHIEKSLLKFLIINRSQVSV